LFLTQVVFYKKKHIGYNLSGNFLFKITDSRPCGNISVWL